LERYELTPVLSFCLAKRGVPDTAFSLSSCRKVRTDTSSFLLSCQKVRTRHRLFSFVLPKEKTRFRTSPKEKGAGWLSATFPQTCSAQRVDTAPLAFRCRSTVQNRGTVPRSSVRLWGIHVRRGLERRNTLRPASQGSASGKRRARYRHGERRQSCAAPSCVDPSGYAGAAAPARPFGDFSGGGKVTPPAERKLSNII